MKIVLGVLIAAGFFVVLSSAGPPRTSSTGPAAAIATRAPTATPVAASPRVGQEGRLRAKNDAERIYVAVDQSAMEALSKAALANDTIGYAAVISRGRAFAVNVGTRVLVLTLDFFSTEIRVLEGPQAGKAGWVNDELVTRL